MKKRKNKTYRAIIGFEGIYEATFCGIVLDLRTDREILPTEEADGRFYYLTDNRSICERLSFKEIKQLRSTKKYYAPGIGQKACKGESDMADVYKSRADALRERDVKIRELERELERLRRYINE